MHSIDVQGMTCGHCVKTVTEAIVALDQKAAVRIDLAHGKVEIDSALPRAELVRAIGEAGYEAAPR